MPYPETTCRGWGGRARGGESGFTLIEILMAVFILVIGILGIVSLFPVGLDASRRVYETSAASITARSALMYLQLECESPGSDASWVFPTTYHENEDAAIRRVNPVGVIESDPDAVTGWQWLKCQTLYEGRASPGRDPGWGDTAWNNHVLIMLSGNAEGKVYQITDTDDDEDGGAPTTNYDLLKCDDSVNFGQEPYNVVAGDVFTIIGNNSHAADPLRPTGPVCTVPADFFDSGTTYPGCASAEYTYACILSGWRNGLPGLARVDVLVFRHFVAGARPEAVENRPAVQHFVGQITTR